MKTIKLLALLLLAINVTVKSQSGGASGTSYVISGASSGTTYGGKVTAGGIITSPYPVGGDVTIDGGDGGAAAGNVILNAGTSTGSAQNGKITLNAPYNNGGGIYLNGITSVSNTLTVTGAITCSSLTASTMLTANGGFTTSKTISVGGIKTTGNISIGTTNNTVNGTTYKLAISGPVVATSIDIVGTVPASDYIFEPGYKLKPLPEIEKYVKENKRLPDVPSAKTFKEKGYSVGQMDDLLLKKVEELTLYVIELNKKVEALQEENRLLKNK